MATSTPLKASGNNETTPASSKLILISSFPKHVSLYDWWLIQANAPSNGRVLGVGGLSLKEQRGVQILHSAVIVKRHNTNTVETADGLTITFHGPINKLRTLLNGFPRKVCDQFIVGFPYCWEELFSEPFAKASNNVADSSADFANNSLSESFDNLPGALLRDFFASTIESSGSCKLSSIFGDMLHPYDVDSLNQRSKFVSPSEKNTQVTVDSAANESCSGHKKMKVKKKQKDEVDNPDAKCRKKFQKELGIGPSTRSTSCMKVACDKDNFLSSSGKIQLIKSLPLSEAPIKRHGGSVTRRNPSSLSSTTRTLFLRNRSIDFHVND